MSNHIFPPEQLDFYPPATELHDAAVRNLHPDFPTITEIAVPTADQVLDLRDGLTEAHYYLAPDDETRQHGHRSVQEWLYDGEMAYCAVRLGAVPAFEQAVEGKSASPRDIAYSVRAIEAARERMNIARDVLMHFRDKERDPLAKKALYTAVGKTASYLSSAVCVVQIITGEPIDAAARTAQQRDFTKKEEFGAKYNLRRGMDSQESIIHDSLGAVAERLNGRLLHSLRWCLELMSYEPMSDHLPDYRAFCYPIGIKDLTNPDQARLAILRISAGRP
jgi:hypothetical protein